MLVTFGWMTVKAVELLQTPICCTWTLPDSAVAATVATICVALQLTILPASLLPSHTLPEPCEEPKFVPLIVTDVPGERGRGDGGHDLRVAPTDDTARQLVPQPHTPGALRRPEPGPGIRDLRPGVAAGGTDGGDDGSGRRRERRCNHGNGTQQPDELQGPKHGGLLGLLKFFVLLRTVFDERRWGSIHSLTP